MATSLEPSEDLDLVEVESSTSDLDAPLYLNSALELDTRLSLDDNPPELQAPLAYGEDLEDEVFEDAEADIIVHDNITIKYELQETFEECERAIWFFFNNDLISAMKIMKPRRCYSLYHSLGEAVFEFIPAVLTFNKEIIERANAAIKNCLSLCHRTRKHYSLVESIGSIIKKPNFAAYSDMEAHAELCYAEALLLNAALTILEGEDLKGLIKGTLKIKACYNSYQYCWNIKESKTWDSHESKMHFKSGVRLGTAAFNLMISLLPPRAMALLEFVGFSGNKYYGLAELEKGSRSPGLRSVLCDLTLLAYNLVVCQFVGGQGDMYVAVSILQRALRKYPNSIWFLVFKARYHFLQGNLNEAINIYKTIADSDKTFDHFRHVCFWELMWIHGLRMEFRKSAYYAELLIDGDVWSKTTHMYIKAAMLLQASGDTARSDMFTISKLLRDAPSHKQRIAGKSLPMEKFVVKRCARYQQQCGRLVLPALELFCIWNLFPMLRNNRPLLQNIMKIVERNTELLDTCEGEWWAGHKGDNRALLLYLHGCCLLALNLPLSALEKFEEIMLTKRDIKDDTFLLPYTVCEMGYCYYKLGNMEKAYNLLIEARKKYSGYELESRLHFRIHARLQLVRDVIGNTKFVTRL